MALFSRDVLWFDNKFSWYIPFIIVVVFIGIWRAFLGDRPDPTLPTVSIERRGLLQRLLPASLFWIKDGPVLVAKGISDFSDRPFQVPTSSGYKVVVPQRFAEELKSHPNLNFNESLRKDFFTNYPGFEVFRQGLQDDTLMQEVVRVKLTQSLGLITEDLVEETAASLPDIFGEDTNFHTVPINENILDIVARLSARIFLGKTLCRNQEWLSITKNYTVDLFTAAQLLRLCPGLVRPLLYWFIPTCTRLRAQVRSAHRLVMDEVDQRRQRAEAALAAGEKASKAADAVSWVVECARGRQPDHVTAQLSLSMAAIHTTSETTLNCVLQLCDAPSLITPLRDEIIQVLSTEGWTKQALYKLRLMDSFLRECQRTRGMSASSMNRIVKKPITLSNGDVLPADSRILVSDPKASNADSFPEPGNFDAHRFLKLRELPGEGNRHQFVTPTNDHMGFGYGQHACPGRFFAANEIKIFLCFWLLCYDFRHVRGENGDEPQGGGTGVKYFTFELSRMADPKCRIEIRRRQEEIDLADPKTGGKEETGKEKEKEKEKEAMTV